MRMFWSRMFSKTSPVHNRTDTQIAAIVGDEWEERDNREEAFRREIAILKRTNKESSQGDFWSLCFYRTFNCLLFVFFTATCIELAKLLLVPDPNLVRHPRQSVLSFPRRLSVSSGKWLCLYATRPVSPIFRRKRGDKNKNAFLSWVRGKGRVVWHPQL